MDEAHMPIMVRFLLGIQNPNLVTNEDFIFIIYLPSLKFTIFIIYNTYDAFDIANPCSMQDG